MRIAIRPWRAGRVSRMDLQTLTVVTFFVSVIMAGTMFALHEAVKRERCLVDWAQAGALHVLASGLGLALTLDIGLPWALRALANVAYIAGNAMILVGVRRYDGRRVRLAWPAVLAATIYALNWLPAVQHSFALRLAIQYPVIVGLSLAVIVEIMRSATPEMRLARLALATIHGLYVAQAVARVPLLVAALSGHEFALLDGRVLNALGSLATVLFLLLNNMACALLVARRQELSLRRAALDDPLTGWHNRRALSEHADRLFARARRQGGAFGVVLLDIDHFKRVNDRYGHPTGDAAICHVTRLGRAVFRAQDFLARIGGEEFCAIVECERAADLRLASERLREAVERAPLAHPDGPIPLTISLGYALLASSDGSWEHTLGRADAALYEAKHAGRNRVAAAA